MALSDNKKLQLLGAIKENELRKEVLIPIYRSMDKFIEVIDNHGANENGSDIILIEKDVFDTTFIHPLF